MAENKVEFNDLEWESPAFGIKSKSVERNGKKIRLLELSKGLEHPDWCETGHAGYIISGELQIDFDGELVRYSEGDALIIADGIREKHIPKPISDKVVLFLIEEL